MSDRILGIDPGTQRLGYGILDGSPRSPVCVASGTLRAGTGELPRRLATLQAALREILQQHQPGCIAMEASFYGRNPQSLIRLGEARGMVMGLAGMHDIPVTDYTPAMVKKAVTGNGNARKETVARMVAALIPGLETHSDPDRSDALAVALCHLHRRRWTQLLEDAARGRP